MQMESQNRMRSKSVHKGWKIAIQGLPLVGAAGTTLLPLQQAGHQFAILIVLVWIQVFFLTESFLARRKNK
jgi:hypothetical protein